MADVMIGVTVGGVCAGKDQGQLMTEIEEETEIEAGQAVEGEKRAMEGRGKKQRPLSTTVGLAEWNAIPFRKARKEGPTRENDQETETKRVQVEKEKGATEKDV